MIIKFKKYEKGYKGAHGATHGKIERLYGSITSGVTSFMGWSDIHSTLTKAFCVRSDEEIEEIEITDEGIRVKFKNVSQDG